MEGEPCQAKVTAQPGMTARLFCFLALQGLRFRGKKNAQHADQCWGGGGRGEGGEAVCVIGVMTLHAMCDFYHAGVLCTFYNPSIRRHGGI
jgi:hypothetical protein